MRISRKRWTPRGRTVDKRGGARRRANQIRFQLLELGQESTVIEVLADRQFLPRYGFPIGLQPLRVLRASNRPGREKYAESDPAFRLERSGLLAMMEYVPGSVVISGGKRVTSRGLLKHFSGVQHAGEVFGQTGWLATCQNEHVSYGLNRKDSPSECALCESPIEISSAMLIPRHGYATAAYAKPKRRGKWKSAGRATTTTVAFAHQEAGAGGGVVEVFLAIGGVTGLCGKYLEQGEVLAFNRGENGVGFAVCTSCGHSDSEKHRPAADAMGALKLPAGFERHSVLDNPEDHRCHGPQNELAVPLRHQVLAARMLTDVLLIDITPFLDSVPHPAVSPTLGHALRIAGASLLEVDSRELNMLESYAGNPARATPVLYDNVPGGVGHVRELVALGRAWLEATRKLLEGDKDHQQRCTSACLDCVLTFDSQHDMAAGKLDRHKALELLTRWLGETQA